ncbi:Tripartite tricarboxylate transporter substrate binding protein [Bordetella tumbae]|uniref:Bug family tripartite tricarboxylate transporter substrate binding protein n=1 Tax=Bordetella tumbae TaxID=1649139 RepID=UPI0039EE31A0
MIKRRLFASALSCLVFFSTPAPAQSFPSKPIRLILGFGPGGGADAIARLYASELQNILDTPVIVENKAGAYEQLGGRATQSADADGHTLWIATTGGVIQAPLIRDMPYDPARDFTHVGVIAEADAVIAVKNDLPIKSMDELIAYARAHPGKLNYGSAGTGAPSHLLVEYIQSVTGITTTHIPYKSAADVASALMSGNVDFAVIVPGVSAPLINAGRIRGIAITAKQRAPALPDVPTLEEGSIAELKNMSVYAFYAVLGPKGIPPDITKKLNNAFNQASMSREVQELSVGMNFRPVVSTPQEFTDRIALDTAIWRKVVQKPK